MKVKTLVKFEMSKWNVLKCQTKLFLNYSKTWWILCYEMNFSVEGSALLFEKTLEVHRSNEIWEK